MLLTLNVDYEAQQNLKENITPFSGEHELLEFDKSITSDKTDSVQGIPVVTSNFAKR